MKPGEISESSRVAVLLKLLEMQTESMERKANVEQTLFQWTTSLLLAVFGVIIALADKTANLPQALAIKVLSTLIITAPALLSIIWIFRRARTSVNNAVAIEKIQELLGVFDEKAYGSGSPFPKGWRGKFAAGRAKRKTPLYYAVVIGFMALCVILAIWLVL